MVDGGGKGKNINRKCAQTMLCKKLRRALEKKCPENPNPDVNDLNFDL